MKNIYILLFSIVTNFCVAQFPSNLKAYFPFNVNLNDSMGLSSPGVNNGALKCADRMAQPNKAYEFEGTGSNIDISADLNFGVTTIAFWFKPNSLASQEQIMLSNCANLYQISTTQIEVRITDASKIRVFIGSSANAPASFRVFTSNAALNTSKWNHVSVVIDNNYTNIKIYLNGTMDLDQQITGLTYSKCINNMRLGTRFNPTNEAPYNGKIDEVMIFNKALNDAEAKSIYSLTNGIKEASSFPVFSLFPNPMNSGDKIKIKSTQNLSNYSFKLIDLEGRELVCKINFESINECTLSFDLLNKGVYFLKAENDGQTIIKKIIVLN